MGYILKCVSALNMFVSENNFIQEMIWKIKRYCIDSFRKFFKYILFKIKEKEEKENLKFCQIFIILFYCYKQ